LLKFIPDEFVSNLAPAARGSSSFAYGIQVAVIYDFGSRYVIGEEWALRLLICLA
jgi:hypothetical protein